MISVLPVVKFHEVLRRKPKLTKSQMLSSKPLRLSDIEPRPLSETKFLLTVPLRPKPLARLFLRIPSTATKTFELDSLGVFVWQHCDGKTSVRQLIRKLAKRYKISERQAEVSTLQFLFTLTKKGLIGMQIQETPNSKRNR